MVFVGMDHGTSGISFSILPSDNKKDSEKLKTFKISREDSKAGKVSAIEELAKYTDLDSIELMVITYAMGDGISSIMPLEKVENRGILSINGAGKVTGGGTTVYSEIENSSIKTLLIPGIHKNTPCLDERFKAAFSHHASPEKISIAYNAYLETGWENMVIGDISSNTVSILIENATIKGAIDACLGAMGIVHGPIDLEMIRDIDEGRKTANECFSHAGAVKIANINNKVAFMKDELLSNYEKGDEKAILSLDTMAMTIAMEIFALVNIAEKVDGIVLTGSMGSMKEPVDFNKKLKKLLGNDIEIKTISKESGSIGAAQIARDIYNGKRNILGINVDI